jgi:class 3 adenylate cyclase
VEGPASELPRGTVTFLFTDIERSTELVRELGAEFGRLRSEHRRILREAFGRHGGHEIDTAGDGFFVAFERAGEAVAAAVAAQRALQSLTQRERTPLRVRMGLHSAEPYLHEDGYVGVGVHRAARICAVGHGGQILVSNATAGIVEDLGLEGVQLLDLGEHELKDIVRPQRLFQLVVEGLPAEFPRLNSLDAGRSRPSVVTLLQTDVAGWQRVLRTLGDEGATEVARAYHDLVIGTVRPAGGRELEVVADTVLVSFERPRDAVRAAITLRKALRTEPWFPGDDRPGVRMAIHSGHVADPTSKHLGSVGFRCVTLCNAAEPWQILVSHATEALLEGASPDVGLRDLGERTLRNLERPVHVFEVQD